MNFNLQFNGECLKYKALKMTFGRGPLHFYRKNMKFFKKVGKNYHSDFERK